LGPQIDGFSAGSTSDKSEYEKKTMKAAGFIFRKKSSSGE
jgi:hypothetical protein